jgi:hypothetical protein
MDVDGTTGGYNLQAAFSTGYLAGESAASAEKKVSGLPYSQSLTLKAQGPRLKGR